MKDRKDEQEQCGTPLRYDARSVLADVKNGSGFYEACKREQSKRMTPQYKSFTVLVDGLKLLSFPADTLLSDDDDAFSEPVYKLNRMVKKYCLEIYGKNSDTGVVPLRKRIEELLDRLHENRKRRQNEAKTAKIPESAVKQDTVAYGNDMPPAIKHEEQTGQNPYGVSSSGAIQNGGGAMQGMPQFPETMQNIQQPPVPMTATGTMPHEIPPIEINGPMTEQQKSLLYEMLLANGCTPEEAQTEIMNLRL